jgi:hypothetical protein
MLCSRFLFTTLICFLFSQAVDKKAGQESVTCPAGSSVLARYEEDIEEQNSLVLVC